MRPSGSFYDLVVKVYEYDSVEYVTTKVDGVNWSRAGGFPSRESQSRGQDYVLDWSAQVRVRVIWRREGERGSDDQASKPMQRDFAQVCVNSENHKLL